MLRRQDIEAIFMSMVGKVGIKLVSKYSNWQDFDELEQHLLDLHEWMVDERGVKGFDKTDFQSKLNEHNAIMRRATTTISIGTDDDITFDKLFGTLQIGNVNQVVYELAKARTAWMIVVKINKIMRKIIGRLIKVVASIKSDEFERYVKDSGMIWMSQEEVNEFADVFCDGREEEILIKQEGDITKKTEA